MSYTTRELATMAVFGTLWGISEMTLGSVLKSLDVPLSGMVLAAVGLIIALVGRQFVPKKGSVFFIGVIAMLLKLFSLGGVVIGPMVGIVSEAILAESALSVLGSPSRIKLILAGGLGVLWVLVQPVVTNPLLFGRALIDVWMDMLRTGSRVLGLGDIAMAWILGGMVLIHLLTGCVAGLISWELGQRLERRMGLKSDQVLR